MQAETKNGRTLIILLNWNGASLTLDCCDSLSKLTLLSYDVLIIDNYSEIADYLKLNAGLQEISSSIDKFCSNDTQKQLNNTYMIDEIKSFLINTDIKIMLARSLINHGFARGCNFGALFANILNYSYILFLNNDTIVDSEFLYKLFLYKNNYDITVPQIRYFDPNSVIWNCGGEINRFGSRRYYYANQNTAIIKAPEKPFSISFATGCCMLMETSFYIESGMFTEDFFFGEEDIDYALRLKKIKAKVACIPNSIIYHKVGASLSGDLTKLRRKAFIHYLNRFINMKKHLGFLWSAWLVPAIVKMALNLKVIYKLSVLQVIAFSLKVIIQSVRKSKVEKDYFEKIMRFGY